MKQESSLRGNGDTLHKGIPDNKAVIVAANAEFPRPHYCDHLRIVRTFFQKWFWSVYAWL